MKFVVGLISLVLLLTNLTLYADPAPDPDKPPPAPGGVYGVHNVQVEDMPYDVRLLMVESGVQNVKLPELEAKAARGEPLSDREKKAYQNLQQIQQRDNYLSVQHNLEPAMAERLADQLAGPLYLTAAQDIRNLTTTGQHQFVDYLAAHANPSGSSEQSRGIRSLAVLAEVVHFQAGNDVGSHRGWSPDLFAQIDTAAAPIMRQANRNADPAMRREAVFGLTYLSVMDPAIDAQLIESVYDSDLTVRREAIKAIGSRLRFAPQMKSRLSAPMLRALQDPDTEIHRTAASVLAQLGPDTQASVPDIIRIGKTTTNRQLKGVVAELLRKIGTPEAIKAANDLGAVTYAAACGGSSPKVLLDNLGISASLENGRRKETAGRFAGWDVITVDAVVRNRNSAPVSYATMTCSQYQSWKTDNPNVHVYGWSCLSNVPTIGTIKAGQEITLRLPLVIRSPETFRLGWGIALTCEELYSRRINQQIGQMYNTHHPAAPAAGAAPVESDNHREIWSNPVTVH
jgi:hypothetical protein